MPTIPVYGFDELEPSILNRAKRRVTGLMDMEEQLLTKEPETDPTKGKQDIAVGELTEEIYDAIKNIEILTSLVRDDSDFDELSMGSASANVLGSLDPFSGSTASTSRLSILSTVRPIIKKGAKQFIIINNALRKINSTYDTIQPNMLYTSLKIYTGFINAVKILKKSAIAFFEIVDGFIIGVNKATDTPYQSVDINDNEDPDEDPALVEEPSLTPDDVPPILSTPNPFPELPSPPEPEPPPPPPELPSKAKRKSFKNKVVRVATDVGLSGNQIADVVDLAEDFVLANNRVMTEQEIDDMVADYLAQALQQPPPPQLVPPQLVPSPPIAPPPENPRPPRNPLNPLPPIAQQPLQLVQQPSGVYKNAVRERARLAGLNMIQRDDVVKEAMDFVNDKGRQATDDEIDDIIEANRLLGAKPAPLVLTAPAELQKIDDLINRASVVKQQLTGASAKRQTELIDKAVKELIDARDEGRKTSTLKVVLQKSLDIADDPTIIVIGSDLDKLPPASKQEYVLFRMAYTKSKRSLERIAYFRKRDAFENFLNDRNIPFIKTKVQAKIDASERKEGQPSSF
jgi:hypothetical protein